jgi:hypothetical protein
MTHPVAWLVLLVVAGVAGACHGNAVERPSGSPARVVAAFSLMAGGERGPRPSNGFDRLRIPPETTDMQLSLAIPRLAHSDRIRAELQAIDGGAVTALPPPVVDASSRGTTVSVLLPVPADGDYVLRLHRVTGEEADVLATTAFRITRLRSAPSTPFTEAAGRGRPGVSSGP